MSLRQALLAARANPKIGSEEMPVSQQSVELLEGLLQAIRQQLIDVQKDGSYRLTERARKMLDEPLRLVRVA